MKKKFIIITSIVLIFVILLFTDFILDLIVIKKQNVISKLNNMDLSKYDNLMIVAHPDDEMIFGGKELINENYLVVCVTCGNNPQRTKEFKNAMKETNDDYIMLGYPDKTLFKRSNWTIEYKYISRDLKYIENYKDWNKIVTHNKKGEYGHPHHIMVHRMVMDTSPHKNLYVFNRYCSEEYLNTEVCPMPESVDEITLEKKNHVLKNYKSQKKVIKRLSHMFPYERIVKVGRKQI